MSGESFETTAGEMLATIRRALAHTAEPAKRAELMQLIIDLSQVPPNRIIKAVNTGGVGPSFLYNPDRKKGPRA